MIGAAMLVATAFAPHATWSLWLSPATFLVWGGDLPVFRLQCEACRAGISPSTRLRSAGAADTA